MNIPEIISKLDAEIGRLQQARELLGGFGTTISKRAGGTPKNSTAPVAAKKRVLSDEARARISAAQKKRWSAQKKTTK